MPIAEPERVAALRGFNRFYTRRIGVLRDGLLDSPFSLTEVRVLYELAHHAPGKSGLNARELATDLTLDAGYLSRILKRFVRAGLVARTRATDDARVHPLALTAKGRAAFDPLDQRSQQEAAALLATLPVTRQVRLIAAMRTIETLLGGPPPPPARWTLRAHRPGDMGWVIEQHGALYAQEYGWDEQFEALVADIAARFIRNFDPRRERCWVAERDGARLGCVFLVRKSATVGKLRLLIVNPAARRLGLGKALVAECIAFARACGYRKLTLWTQDNLHAARHLYEAAGFRRVAREPHTSFGHALVGETWELKL